MWKKGEKGLKLRKMSISVAFIPYNTYNCVNVYDNQGTDNNQHLEFQYLWKLSKPYYSGFHATALLSLKSIQAINISLQSISVPFFQC